MLARHLHTPISEVEDMEMDRFTAYSTALHNLLLLESGRSASERSVKLPEGRPTVAQQAREVFDQIAAEHRKD